MIGRRLLMTAALLAAACGGKKAGSDDSATGLGTTATGTGASQPPDVPQPARPLDASSQGGSMVTDFQPNIAFRAHAASVLKVTPEQIDGGAVDAVTAAKMPHSVGGAWAYTVWLATDRTREVRGWVMADGTVITPDQHLGRLFEEAGIWTKTPAWNEDQLAEHLIWSYGMGHQVVIEPRRGQPVPTLTLAADGSGSFRFFFDYQQGGPGGAGGGPTTVYEANVTLTADHQAKLTRTLLKSP